MIENEHIYEKNYAIEFYRILATMIICAHHFHSLHYTYNNPAVIVEFFFILSGYFMMKSFDKEQNHHLLRYAKKRFLRLYPEYIVAYGVLLVWLIAVNHISLNPSMIFSEVTLLNKSLFVFRGYNFPGWYICTLFWGELILYFLLSRKRKIFLTILAPILIIIGYVYLFQSTGGNLENWKLLMPLLRTVCGLSIGILIYVVNQHQILNKISIREGTVIEIISIFLIAYSLLKNDRLWLPAILGFIALIIVSTQKIGLLSTKLLNLKVFGKISRYAYGMYLNQVLMISVVWYIFNTNSGLKAWLFYYIGVLTVSIIINRIIYMMKS